VTATRSGLRTAPDMGSMEATRASRTLARKTTRWPRQLAAGRRERATTFLRFSTRAIAAQSHDVQGEASITLAMSARDWMMMRSRYLLCELTT
jgi:hypothetical protein